MDTIVLAYSGDLDTSIAIPWLAEQRDAAIVAVTLDLGQGRELDDARERALSLGAVRAHVAPALAAGATDRGPHALAAALARPLIAKQVVEIARIEGARAVAHGV